MWAGVNIKEKFLLSYRGGQVPMYYPLDFYDGLFDTFDYPEDE